jgi:caa(3)-type oxidase subunit IV
MKVESAHSQTTSHPRPNYVGIFIWLIVITAVEVAVGYTPHDVVPKLVTYPILLAMAIVKALLVALYFMHLRYDSRWFTLILAVALPLGVLFVLAMVLGFARLGS